MQQRPAAPVSLASRLGSISVLMIMAAILLLPFLSSAPQHNGHTV